MIHTLTPDNIDDIIQSDIPVVIDFYADWCGPCKMLSPIFESLSVKLDDKAKFVKVDVGSYREIASKFGVSSLPTILLIKSGVVVDKVIGFTPIGKLEAFILS